MSCENKLILK